MVPELRWPPTEEDLRRMYVDEKMSAMKIAMRYGLKYASPKTAESTVLYHLKRAGITRRDPAEHVRKVTEEMVDGWVKRYEAGESLKQIAGDEVSPATVFNHVKERGVVLRDKVEAQIRAVTKHARSPFAGDSLERAYLSGFVLGDCAVVRHGRAIRVRTGTTHPAMAELFAGLFGANGFVHRYPRASRLTGHEWSLEVDLDSSFEFLLEAKESKMFEVPADNREFLSYLAGFFDADGGAYLHQKEAGSSFEIYFVNTLEELILPIHQRLLSLGYSSKLERNAQAEKRLGATNEGWIWRIRLWKQGEVHELARSIPTKHGEKIAKLEVVERFLQSEGASRRQLFRDWSHLLEEIQASRRAFIEAAKDTLSAKGASKNPCRSGS